MSDEYWGKTYGRGIDYDIPCEVCGKTYETDAEARECCANTCPICTGPKPCTECVNALSEVIQKYDPSFRGFVSNITPDDILIGCGLFMLLLAGFAIGQELLR